MLYYANISILLAGLRSRTTQRTVGNWRALRSWRELRSCLPPPPLSSRLRGWLQPGWDRPLWSWRREVVFPSRSSGRPRRSSAASPWMCGLKEPLGLSLCSRCFSPGWPQKVSTASPRIFTFSIFVLPEETAGVRAAHTRRGVAFTGALWMPRNPRGTSAFRSSFRFYLVKIG